MCGIAGWIALPGVGAPSSTLKRMVERIAHRGPDDAGYAVVTSRTSGAEVALGHCRLAIIAPTGGRQPMQDETGQIVLTYNGEIYNFRELRRELRAQGAMNLSLSGASVLRAILKAPCGST